MPLWPITSKVSYLKIDPQVRLYVMKNCFTLNYSRQWMSFPLFKSEKEIKPMKLFFCLFEISEEGFFLRHMEQKWNVVHVTYATDGIPKVKRKLIQL